MHVGAVIIDSDEAEGGGGLEGNGSLEAGVGDNNTYVRAIFEYAPTPEHQSWFCVLNDGVCAGTRVVKAT